MDVHDLVNNEPMTPSTRSLSMDHLPSPQQISQAKANVEKYGVEVSNIQTQIQAEDENIAALIQAHESTVKSLKARKRELQDKISFARAYLAPIRKLPNELLAEVFLIIFAQGDHKCGWTLSRVSQRWRRLALSLHVLWSSISLSTTTTLCPADTIRLWIERSGSRCPLDIDITLKSNSPAVTQEKTTATSRRRLLNSHHHHALPSLWSAVGNVTVHSHASSSLSPPHGAHSSHTASHDSDGPWGYIVFYYLVAELHRWRKFRFFFGTPFSSLKALDTIQGNAPLLQEFVVGCTESSFFPPSSEQWQWLPSGSSAASPTPALRSLELRNVPFRWSSPLLSNLRKLKLVSNNLSVQPLTLNRILSIIHASPLIEVLELNLVSQAHILPLSPVTLDHLRELKLGGSQGQNPLLQQLIGQLITPALQSLTIEADSRSESSTMTETLTSLFIRSSQPTITSFSYGLASTANSGPSPYTAYGTLGFPTSLLRQLYHLEHLTVASCPMEPILSALSSTSSNQDDDDDASDFGGPGIFGGGAGGAPNPGNAFGTPVIPPSMPAIQLGALANAVHSSTNAHNNSTANLPNLIATAASNLAAAVAAAANAPTTANPGNHFNDDYLCPFLKNITFKHCHPHSDGIGKIIKMVQARNPDGVADLAAVASGDTAIPRRIKTLEFSECGHIGGDVIGWLEERVLNVVYTEAPNSAVPSYRNSSPYGFSF